MACCGKCLEDSSVKNVLVENETYRPNTVNSVMRGSHYVRGKRGMSVLLKHLDMFNYHPFSTKLNLIDINLYLIPLLKRSQCLKQADGSDQEISQ